MNKTETWKDAEDNVYYNITLRNYEVKNREAFFSETRVQNVLDNPSEYELSVVRFSVPGYNIPVMWYRPDYKIYMEFDGYTAEYELKFPTNSDVDLYGRPAIWNLQEVINMMNTSLKNCFDEIKLNRPLAPPTEAPFFIIDKDNNRIKMYAEQLYENNPPPPAPQTTIRIAFSELVQKLIPTFIYYKKDLPIGVDGDAYQFIISNQYTNSTTFNGKPYYVITQEEESLYLWTELQSIQFETNSIPVNPEFLPTATNNIRRIITDFEPEKGNPTRQVIQFFPQGPLRYYDLLSNYALRTIDMVVYWEDRDGITYPIQLTRGDVLTLKLQFRKKKHRQYYEDPDGFSEFD
jgi:hypothetical protein